MQHRCKRKHPAGKPRQARNRHRNPRTLRAQATSDHTTIEAGSGTGFGIKLGLLATSVEPLVEPSRPAATLIVVVLERLNGKGTSGPANGVTLVSLVPWASGPCKGVGVPSRKLWKVIVAALELLLLPMLCRKNAGVFAAGMLNGVATTLMVNVPLLP